MRDGGQGHWPSGRETAGDTLGSLWTTFMLLLTGLASTSLNVSGKLLGKNDFDGKSSYSLNPHRDEPLEVHAGVSRQPQDALPVLVAGVGRVGEVLRPLHDGFQRCREVFLGLKIKVLPKSFDVRLKTRGHTSKRVSVTNQNGLRLLAVPRRPEPCLSLSEGSGDMLPPGVAMFSTNPGGHIAPVTDGHAEPAPIAVNATAHQIRQKERGHAAPREGMTREGMTPPPGTGPASEKMRRQGPKMLHPKKTMY